MSPANETRHNRRQREAVPHGRPAQPESGGGDSPQRRGSDRCERRSKRRPRCKPRPPTPTTSAAAAARAGNGAAHQPGHLPRRERHSAATAQTAGGTSAAGRRGLLSAAEHHNSGEHDKRPPPRTSAATAAPTEKRRGASTGGIAGGADKGARAERSTTPAGSKRAHPPAEGQTVNHGDTSESPTPRAQGTSTRSGQQSPPAAG